MTENSFETQYDLTKKSKVRKIYESNKILIFSLSFITIILITFFIYYNANKDNQRKILSENYIQAKIYLNEEKKELALDKLKEIVLANDPTYSTLSFFLILNQNLVTDFKEVTVLFEHVLNNNKFDDEMKNLLIYKKAVFSSNYIDESVFLMDLQPLLNSNSIWKPHALLLAGDYFLSKEEFQKAKEFYMQLIAINNLQQNIFDKAKYQLTLINEK